MGRAFSCLLVSLAWLWLLSTAPAAAASAAPSQPCRFEPPAARSAASPTLQGSAAGPTTEMARLTDDDTAVRRVLELAAERLAVMPAVAAWKSLHHAPVSDPAREQVVIRTAAERATAEGLLAQPVERLFALQTRLARELEAACQESWGAGGPPLTGHIPDLATELRPRLDAVTREQLRALYLAAPGFARQDFAIRYRAMALQILSGWTPAQAGELLSALGAVRFEGRATLMRARAAGMVRIGTTGDYAPFSIATGGTLRGTDIVLAQALARALGVEAVFVRTTWPTLLADLRADRFDLAIGGVAATPARRAAAAVSRPYLTGGKTIIARCTEAARFASLAALDAPGVRVIVNPGGTNEQFLREHVHRASIRIEPDNTAIFDEIRTGRADAMITDDVEVQWQTRRHPELCRSYPGLLTHADKVVLLARDAGLVQAVDRFLSRALDEHLPQQLLEHSLAQ